jgi:hypothetical protein
MEENNLHNDELVNSFEKDLESAFILNERKALKSLFKNIDTQNDLEEKEIESAFVLNERKRLKEQFKEIEDAEKIEEEAKINARFSNYTNQSNWKRFLIAASIVGLLLTTGIWILNTKNSAPDKEFVKVETKEIINQDSIKRTLKQQQEYFVVLNNSKCVNSATIGIKKIKQFGFGSNKVEKIKVVNYNIDKQISILKEYENMTLLDSNYYLKNLIKSNIDSITAFKNKYSLDLDTLKTYNINSEDKQVYYLDNKYYLRIGTFYYELSRTRNPIVLKKLDNLDIIEQLDAL